MKGVWFVLVCAVLIIVSMPSYINTEHVNPVLPVIAIVCAAGTVVSGLLYSIVHYTHKRRVQ